MFRRRRSPAREDDCNTETKRARLSKAPMYWQQREVFTRGDHVVDRQKQWASVGAWFLGPKAENGEVFRDLLTKAIDSHIGFRHSYFSFDPPYVTDELRETGSFSYAMKNLQSEMEKLQLELKNSVPFLSSRYKGHVLWETAMPANLGYMSAMLYNQNNCASEVSTVTSKYEMEVGKDLCVMLGYDRDRCMGHLTAGGSVANIEAIWAGRNVKYFPLGLQEALLKDERLSGAKGYKDDEALLYLKEVGPDTLIPCFSVNLKGNQSVEVCNAINTAIFESLSHTPGEHTAFRIPTLVTSSSLVSHVHSVAATNFKRRLGLNSNSDAPVKYIKTTCMDPWATSIEFMNHMASIMRNSILCAIGRVTGPTALHNFVSTGVVNEQNEVIACYVGDFNGVSKQYEAIVKLKFVCNKDAEKYIATQKKLSKWNDVLQPIVFRSRQQRLHDVFFKDTGYSGELEEFDCFIGLPSDNSNHPFMCPNMKITDVPRYEHFDNHKFPEHSSYFMYGDRKNVFLFHIPTKSPDFFQVVQLDGFSDSVGIEGEDELLLKHGIEVEIPNIPGEPVILNGEIQESLDKNEFNISFVGINGKEVKTKVKLGKKIWFAPSTRTFSNLISVTDRKSMLRSENLARHLVQLNLS